MVTAQGSPTARGHAGLNPSFSVTKKQARHRLPGRVRIAYLEVEMRGKPVSNCSV